MENQPAKPVTDLRDRIAAVLYDNSVRRAGLDFTWATLTSERVKDLWRVDADAVIAALGLREEDNPDIAGSNWGVHRRIVGDYTFIPGPEFPRDVEPVAEND